MHRLELALHCGVVAFGLAHLAWHGFSYSLQFEAGAAWDGYAPGLRPGWMFGRRMDLSDDQWRDFRSSASSLTLALLGFILLSHTARRATGHRAAARAAYYVAAALVLLTGLHGVCIVYVVGFALASYYCSRLAAGGKHGAATIWAFNLSMLLLIRIYEGFPFAAVHPALSFLDRHRGSVRWHICFNLTVLRMLSFGMDLHWARMQVASSESKDLQVAPSSAQSSLADGANTRLGGKYTSQDGLSESKGTKGGSFPARQRQKMALPSEADYSLVMFLAHALYFPLYIAGPVITFQDFAWQLRQQEEAHNAAHLTKISSTVSKPGTKSAHGGVTNNVSWWDCGRYATKLAADVACLELLTHTIYANSLAKHKLGAKYAQYGLPHGPVDIGATGWWVLTFMWLKFAVIWRTFRLAALLDGIEPPENMVRCFANNYDVEGFWRGWHASFNRWLVRYLYIPVGGSTQKMAAVGLTFLFVAVWHDLEWHLIGWAGLMCLAFLPEILIKRAVAGSVHVGRWRGTPAWRHACAAAATINIAALMAANLAGFVVGMDGLGGLFKGLAASPVYVGGALVCFWSAAQLMFVLREPKSVVS